MKTSIRILVSVFTILFIYSCGNDTIVNPVTSSGPFTLNGNIENWIYGGNIKLKAQLSDTNYFGNSMLLDSNIVSVNGAFSLKLNVPPDSLLYPITFYPDTTCIVNVNVNPPNTRSSNILNLNLFSDSMQVGYIYRSNYINDTAIVPGEFFVYYMYLNQNVSITGSVICSNIYYHDTIVYNFSGIRGWNKVVIYYESITNNSLKYIISTNEPAGGKWFALNYWKGYAYSDEPALRQRIFRFNECIPCR
jgi:hypothetical protein